jgi:hypothetical protein
VEDLRTAEADVGAVGASGQEFESGGGARGLGVGELTASAALKESGFAGLFIKNLFSADPIYASDQNPVLCKGCLVHPSCFPRQKNDLKL